MIATLLTAALVLPAPGAPLGAPLAAPSPELAWFQGDYEGALAASRGRGRLLCVYFYASTPRCVEFWSGPMADGEVQAELADMVCFAVDLQSGGSAATEVADRFGIETVPSMVFVGPDEPEDVLLGALGTEGLRNELRRIARGEKTVSAFRRAVAEAPDDLEAHDRLVKKLDDVGRWEAAYEARKPILELDPEAETRVGAWAWYGVTKLEAYGKKAETGELDCGPMYQLAERVTFEDIRIEIWSWLTTGERIREDYAGMRAAAIKLWGMLEPPEGGELSGYLNPGCDLVDACWMGRDELSRDERKLALEAAESMIDLCERMGIPEADGVWPNLYGKLARAKFLNKKRKDAVALLERCLELDPENASFAEDLAVVRGGA